VTATPYCEGTVVLKVVPFQNQSEVSAFQQNNVPQNTAGQTKCILRQSNIDILKWPTMSPDLLQIEHV
jgi:hypothetical protein